VDADGDHDGSTRAAAAPAKVANPPLAQSGSIGTKLNTVA
jgi:hypothetical protein